MVASGCVLFFFSATQHRFNTDRLYKDIRVNHALLVLEVVKDHPLTGIGYGMETFGKKLDLPAYKKKIEDLYQVKYSQAIILTDPHNLYTDILVRTGIIGLIIYLVFICTLFKMLWQLNNSGDQFVKIWAIGLAASLSGYLVIGLFEPVFSHIYEYDFALLVSFVLILWRLQYVDVAASQSQT